MRTILTLSAVGLLLAAGCIAPTPETEPTPQTTEPPADRIEGMTADVQASDKAVPCGDGGVAVPPTFCAERNLTVTGRSGVERLPVLLEGVNGAVSVRRSAGDAWSFRAVVKVSAPTQEMADQGLDEAWTWTHEEGGRHVLKAGPLRSEGVPLPASVGVAQVYAARYEVTLPAWTVLEKVELSSGNGQVVLDGFATDGLRIRTSNGQVIADASGGDADIATSNGQIILHFRPTATGTIQAQTSNGQIVAELASGGGRAYDVDGKTVNGIVTLDFDDAETTTDERSHKHVRTTNWDSAATQTTVKLETQNGMIRAEG